MIGFNREAQTILAILMVAFAVLLIALQIARKVKTDTTFTRIDNILWICEFLTVLSLIAIVVADYFLYLPFIPSNSPGCLPHISQFGVVASGVDASKFAVTPAASYPALTYQAAVSVYRSSPNGLATGYFAWDGLSVIILNSSAYQLATGATIGTSWVFQDLSTTKA